MVAGHLQEKKGYYYAVLSYRNADGRRKTKWISTGLPVKGNKKRAGAATAFRDSGGGRARRSVRG